VSTPALRLVRPYSLSRRAPAALAALLACAVALRLALIWHWIDGHGFGGQLVAMPIEAGAAVVIAATVRSPFGEVERASGHWLPWLRLSGTVALTCVAACLMLLAPLGLDLPGGDLVTLRALAGLTGIALLSAAAFGTFAWAGPLAYLVVAELAIDDHWTAGWIWSGRPPHDRDAAVWAVLAFVAGLVATTLSPRE
jgi:hypothetical protein